MVSVCDEVDKEVRQTPNSEALFAKELYDLLASLEVASPGFGKAIACILTEKVSTSKIEKVKKALRSKGKKCGVIEKAPAAA